MKKYGKDHEAGEMAEASMKTISESCIVQPAEWKVLGIHFCSLSVPKRDLR